jgi:hypothetical protein
MRDCELDSFVLALGTYETERFITLIKIGRGGGGEVEFQTS